MNFPFNQKNAGSQFEYHNNRSSKYYHVSFDYFPSNCHIDVIPDSFEVMINGKRSQFKPDGD